MYHQGRGAKIVLLALCGVSNENTMIVFIVLYNSTTTCWRKYFMFARKLAALSDSSPHPQQFGQAGEAGFGAPNAHPEA